MSSARQRQPEQGRGASRRPAGPRRPGRGGGPRGGGPRAVSRPARPGSGAAPLPGGLPSAACRTHMVNGAGGQANGWAGLAGGGGGGRGGSSPAAAATPASSARSRPLLAPRRRRRRQRRRRARPRCPECTARGAAPSARERREVEGEGREDGGGRGERARVRACVRARAGEAGRRLVTQQNARAPPPRLRSLCFRAPARLSRDLYGKGGASRLLRDASRARRPRPVRSPRPLAPPARPLARRRRPCSRPSSRAPLSR